MPKGSEPDGRGLEVEIEMKLDAVERLEMAYWLSALLTAEMRGKREGNRNEAQ